MTIRSVLLLAPGSVVHTRRWARAIAARGVRVVVASQHAYMPGDWGGATLEILPWRGQLGYVANARAFRSLVRRYDPDVVNVHFATGYGLCALFSGVRPYVLSVWGSDVYDFPERSWLHRIALRRSLKAAGRIASTSKVMAEQVVRLLGDRPPLSETPFGVDTRAFRPARSSIDERVVIGTVKTLASHYGIDILLRGYALLVNDPELVASGIAARLALSVFGTGPQERELRELARSLDLDPAAIFKGGVAHENVPAALHSLDIYVAMSRSESFGVAIIEASSCGLPVVVSDVGGLPEVVDDGVSGLVLPREDPYQLHAALKRLVLDPAERVRMGKAGVTLVAERYEWERCVDRMFECYESLADVCDRCLPNP